MNKLDFKISSGLKNIIGKELITNDRIAIFELVKNSYDANARNVRIIFKNIKNPDQRHPATILIVDDGDGMSYPDLVSKWLFVGYSEKRDVPVKDFRDKIQSKRIFAGAKGVGRFSCDRLGAKLKLYTKRSDEAVVHSLDVDWTRFEQNQKKEFQTIKVDYSTIKKLEVEELHGVKFHKGTVLEISLLNDKWDWAKLLELRKYLQRLINPAIGDDEEEFKIRLEAAEYLVEDGRVARTQEHNLINGPIKNIIFEKLDIKTTQIRSLIEGGKIKTELTDKGKFIFSLEEKNEWPDLKSITVNLFFLNPSAKNSFTRAMGMEPIKYGSIFLYKNKFRIHPYGDEGDDWLGLEKRKGQGYARFLSSRELMGRVEIQGEQEDFKEVSSRDGGVIRTKSYQHLVVFFIEKVLRRLEKYVIEGIDWDSDGREQQKSSMEIKRDSLALIQKLAGQIKDPEKNIKFNPELLSILKGKQIENLPQVIKNVEALGRYIKAPAERAYIEKQLKSVRLATRNLEIEKSESEKKLHAKERESLFLSKAISTDRDVIVNLNHTIENSTQMIKEILLVMNRKIQGNKPIAEIVPQVDELSLENEKIKVLAGIVSMANFNTKIEFIEADVVVYIKDYLERITHADLMDFQFHNADISHQVKFRPLEISIILDNFLGNAKKAGASLVSIMFRVVGKKLHVLIGDDGRGISAESKGCIFTRGYTTTRGSGIGLHHIRTMLEGMGGSVEYVGNGVENLGKGACFKIILP